MHALTQLLHQFLDVTFLINAFGYPGIFAIVFAETGLMLGFFLPGDSLLITAGIFASKGHLNIFILIPILFVAATLGNMVGYHFGKQVGKRLFQRKDSRFFRKEYLEKAQVFYNKYGGKAILIARFMPIIRTFAPIVAGIIEMEYKLFMFFNILGSLLWAVGLTLGGFFLGKIIPDKYFEYIILVIIILSISPAFYEVLKTKENRAKIIHRTKRLVRRNK